MGVVAACALYALMVPVASRRPGGQRVDDRGHAGSATATSRINIDAVKPRPATDCGLALPSFAVTDDGSGPRVRNFVLEAAGTSTSRGSGSRPGSAISRSPLSLAPPRWPVRHLHCRGRGLAFTTTGNGALSSLSLGQMPASAKRHANQARRPLPQRH